MNKKVLSTVLAGLTLAGPVVSTGQVFAETGDSSTISDVKQSLDRDKLVRLQMDLSKLDTTKLASEQREALSSLLARVDQAVLNEKEDEAIVRALLKEGEEFLDRVVYVDPSVQKEYDKLQKNVEDSKYVKTDDWSADDEKKFEDNVENAKDLLKGKKVNPSTNLLSNDRFEELKAFFIGTKPDLTPSTAVDGKVSTKVDNDKNVSVGEKTILNKNGEVVDKNGKVVIGKDGKPVKLGVRPSVYATQLSDGSTTPDKILQSIRGRFNLPLVESKALKSDSKTVNSLMYIFNIDSAQFAEVTNRDISVYDIDTAAFIQDNRTMLPLRYVAYVLGCDVNWNDGTRTATFTKDGKSAEVTIGSSIVRLSDGSTVHLDSAPVMKNDRMHVSLTNISNLFGVTNGDLTDSKDQAIEWDSANRACIIHVAR